MQTLRELAPAIIRTVLIMAMTFLIDVYRESHSLSALYFALMFGLWAIITVVHPLPFGDKETEGEQ